MMYSQSQLLDLFNEYLSAYSFDRLPRSLYDPVKYVLSLGGKRIRPVLMMMAHNIYKEEVANILPVAMGIEMYHNYTLLHDDLMDRADKRHDLAHDCGIHRSRMQDDAIRDNEWFANTRYHHGQFAARPLRQPHGPTR